MIDKGFGELENKLEEYELLSDFINSNGETDFDKNWNKLMQAVEKIESIRHQKYGRFIVTIAEDTCLIRSTNVTKNDVYSKMYCTKGNKLNSVYNSCLMFVEFWNNLNK